MGDLSGEQDGVWISYRHAKHKAEVKENTFLIPHNRGLPAARFAPRVKEHMFLLKCEDSLEDGMLRVLLEAGNNTKQYLWTEFTSDENQIYGATNEILPRSENMCRVLVYVQNYWQVKMNGFFQTIQVC